MLFSIFFFFFLKQEGRGLLQMESKHMYKVYSLFINGHTDTDT